MCTHQHTDTYMHPQKSILVDQRDCLDSLMLSNSLTKQSSHQIRHVYGSLSLKNSRDQASNVLLFSLGTHAIFRICQGLSESIDWCHLLIRPPGERQGWATESFSNSFSKSFNHRLTVSACIIFTTVYPSPHFNA